jgi:hypothetical protein
VLRVRVIEERRAQGDLARSEALLHAADREVDARRAGYLERPRAAGALSPSALRAVELQGLRCLERVDEARAERDAAVARRDDAAAALSRRSVRRKSTERLLERREQEQAHAGRVAAQRELDERILLGRDGRERSSGGTS